jgi:signal peptidase complex subunit 2
VAGIELDQDTAWFDLKLFVMVLACIAGLVAQFYPIPFPDNRVLVLACVGIYFLISGVLQYITWFVDRDYIFQTRDGRKAAAATAGGASSSGGMPPLHVRTAMAKYDDKYSVILESPRGVQQGATLSFSVGKVFCAVSKSTSTMRPGWIVGA